MSCFFLHNSNIHASSRGIQWSQPATTTSSEWRNIMDCSCWAWAQKEDKLQSTSWLLLSLWAKTKSVFTPENSLFCFSAEWGKYTRHPPLNCSMCEGGNLYIVMTGVTAQLHPRQSKVTGRHRQSAESCWSMKMIKMGMIVPNKCKAALYTCSGSVSSSGSGQESASKGSISEVPSLHQIWGN